MCIKFNADDILQKKKPRNDNFQKQIIANVYSCDLCYEFYEISLSALKLQKVILI